MQRCMTTGSRHPESSTARARSRVRSTIAALGVLAVVAVGVQLGSVPPASAASLPGPLHTDGRWIVNDEGRRVKLAAVNWSGAETQAFVVGGLDQRPLADLAALVAAGGFNSVRLPWSVQLVRDNPVIDNRYLSANPDLRGRRALDVLDAVVDALGQQGVMVILDNHRSRADWCCDEAQGDGLWYTAEYPESMWLDSWRTMAERYRDRANVVGAELRNEIRRDPAVGTPTWGDGNLATDWRLAAERAGNAVLAVDPDLLIVVGGTDYQTDLTGVRDSPIRLSVANRLVYAPHDYRFTQDAASLTDYASFRRELDERWGYILEEGQSRVAPLWLSETGTCTNPNATEQCNPNDAIYWSFITRYLAETDIDVAYWPFNGTQGEGYGRLYGAPETYGLLAPDWSGFGDQAVLRDVQALQQPTQGPGVTGGPPPGTPSGSNLLADGGFETGSLASWTRDWHPDLAGVESTFAHTGGYDAFLHPRDGQDVAIAQTVRAPTTTTYRLRAWAATNLGGGVVRLGVDVAGTQVRQTVIRQDAGYTEYLLEFSATTGQAIKVWYYSAGAEGWATLDSVTLTPV